MTTQSASTRESFEALKTAYPLLDVIERAGVQTRRSGANSYHALCPFHTDTNPSLSINVEWQRFRCFGCGAHGDVLDWVKRKEQMATLAEARAWLAGTPAPAPRRERAQTHAPRRERRWDRLTLEEQLVMNTAGALYRDSLWRTPAARAYLRMRGIPDWVVRGCGVGFADGRSLEALLRKRGGLSTAEDLGLLRRPERGEGGRPLRERFAGRIVVPEIRAGQPIWFIGRKPGYVGHVKYLAMPGERPVLGLERAAGRYEVYLVEGVFDWLTAIGWRLAAMSTCGTDFPPDRLGWLARARVIFGVLDGDRAGREAAGRFGELFGPRWRPVELPQGTDLNDLGCRSDGRALFFQLVAAARQKAAEQPDRPANVAV